MSERLRSLLFAGALCLVCSILLTAASTGLQPFQEHNLRLEKKRNILKAVGLIGTEEVSAEKEIERFYSEKIRSFWVGPGGELKGLDNKEETDLPLYVRIEERDIKAYVVPIESRGLWGKIHGYLAIEKDGTTIAGFTVFKHAETPGLGGRSKRTGFKKNGSAKKSSTGKARSSPWASPGGRSKTRFRRRCAPISWTGSAARRLRDGI